MRRKGNTKEKKRKGEKKREGVDLKGENVRERERERERENGGGLEGSPTAEPFFSLSSFFFLITSVSGPVYAHLD